MVRIVPSLAHSRLHQVWYNALSAKFGTFLRVGVRVRVNLNGNVPQLVCSIMP